MDDEVVSVRLNQKLACFGIQIMILQHKALCILLLDLDVIEVGQKYRAIKPFFILCFKNCAFNKRYFTDRNAAFQCFCYFNDLTFTHPIDD